MCQGMWVLEGHPSPGVSCCPGLWVSPRHTYPGKNQSCAHWVLLPAALGTWVLEGVSLLDLGLGGTSDADGLTSAGRSLPPRTEALLVLAAGRAPHWPRLPAQGQTDVVGPSAPCPAAP